MMKGQNIASVLLICKKQGQLVFAGRYRFKSYVHYQKRKHTAFAVCFLFFKERGNKKMERDETVLQMQEISIRCREEAEALYEAAEELSKTVEGFSFYKDLAFLELELNAAGRKIITEVMENAYESIKNTTDTLMFVKTVLKDKIEKMEKMR